MQRKILWGVALVAQFEAQVAGRLRSFMFLNPSTRESLPKRQVVQSPEKPQQGSNGGTARANYQAVASRQQAPFSGCRSARCGCGEGAGCRLLLRACRGAIWWWNLCESGGGGGRIVPHSPQNGGMEGSGEERLKGGEAGGGEGGEGEGEGAGGSRMSEMVARTGRHQQRYEDGYRLVAGCIPYRYKGGEGDGEGVEAEVEERVEVLMITSQHGQKLVFPKGGWETDETMEQAACREAFEEAGVRGLLHGNLGTWDFKSKHQQGVFCPEGLCRARMFPLAVTEELDLWPEHHLRRRQWFSVQEAIVHCRHEWMRGALEKCIAYLSSKSAPLPSSSSL